MKSKLISTSIENLFCDWSINLNHMVWYFYKSELSVPKIWFLPPFFFSLSIQFSFQCFLLLLPGFLCGNMKWAVSSFLLMHLECFSNLGSAEHLANFLRKCLAIQIQYSFQLMTFMISLCSQSCTLPLWNCVMQQKICFMGTCQTALTYCHTLWELK